MLKLFNAGENFVVESMRINNVDVEFVHDKETGKNFFTQKTLASMFGVSVVNVSRLLNTYSKRINESNDFLTKPIKVNIRLKTDESNQRIKFYNFKAVSYLAHRIDTVEALNMLEWIDSSLNTMFNVAVGNDSINSNKDWLKNQCEVKAFQAETCRKSSNDLYGCGLEHVADKTWSEYKKLNAEALKYKELYLDYDKIDRIVANERDNSTMQLKLI